MKRWILVLVTTVTAVLVVGAGAMALDVGRDDSGRRPTSGPRWDADRSMMPGRMMAGGMMPAGMHGMHGMRVTSERAWLTEMIAHHQEAVDSAAELARSDREEMRDFGAAIIADQTAQIDLMEGWLDDWYGGPAAGVDYEPMMRDLTRLTGDRLDRVFLQDMIGHHMMAVMMSQQLLARDLARHDQVVDLAVEIRDAQHQEIFQMHDWLAEWFGGMGRGMGPGMGLGMGPGMMHAR